MCTNVYHESGEYLYFNDVCRKDFTCVINIPEEVGKVLKKIYSKPMEKHLIYSIEKQYFVKAKKTLINEAKFDVKNNSI